MRRSLRGLLLSLAMTCVATVCPAQIASYSIVPNFTSLPAGSDGGSMRATVENLPPGTNFNVCFYTGFGSTAPIVPDSLMYLSDTASIAFQVPASSIQQVPPASFSNGIFSALLYTVDPSASSCTGSDQAQGTAAAITLRYPTLTSLSITSTPHLNPKLTSLLPSNMALNGMNFLGGSSASTVLFNSTSSIPGNVSFISSTKLVSTIPTTLPLSVSSVNVQVCNIAVYSYCSASQKLGLTTVPTSPGVVTATPNTGLPSQLITVSATFGPVKPTVAGAPGGIVDFHYASTELGQAPLILDKTGVFAAAPPSNFQAAHALGSPIIADFNQDGIPDLLLLESRSNTLHLLTGTTPSGSFAADRPISFQVSGSPLLVLSAAVADLNHDGFPDIVLLGQISGRQTNSIYTLLNDGSGSFGNPALSYSPVYGSRILSGDFDHDGKQDVLVAGALSDSTGFQTLLGDGLGGFTAGPVSSGLNTAPSSFGGYTILAANLNNDVYPDIAILNGATADGSQISKSVAIFQNDGHGAFTLKTTVTTDGTASTSLFIAPPSFGQLPAILLASSSTATLSVFLNQSTIGIAFSGTAISTNVPNLKQAVIGDFNGDSLLDFVVDDGATVHVLTGDDKGGFTYNYPGLSTTSDATTTLLAASDENADTYADLLTLTGSTDPASPSVIHYALSDFVTAGTATATLPPSTFPAGLHVIQARTPGTFTVECGSVTTNLTIAKLVPVITWPAPAPIVMGTPLTATQLDATVTGPSGEQVAGSLAYKPSFNAVLAPGVQTLTVVFTPDNPTDYATVSANVSLNVVAFSLTSLSGTTAVLGDAAKTITLTGSGFLPTAVVQMDGSPVATTYVNGTTLTAIIPAKDFLTVHTILVDVHDASLGATSASLGIDVTAPAAAVDFSGPTSIAPGSQITLNFKLTSAYPVDLTATFTIGFNPAVGLPDDPSVQFSNGGRTFTVDIPAGTTTLDPILIQSGTVAGTLTVGTKLEAGGADVTPASARPLIIDAGLAAPGIISVKFTSNGNMLTVTIRGFSNTREITGAKFHFTPVAGGKIKTPDVTINAQALYASWYTNEASLQYGSTCTYTQVFNLSSDANVVGQVSVILTNTQGASPEVNTP